MVESEIAQLRQMRLEELQAWYQKLFPGEVIPNNQKYLQRRIAYKVQEARGGLPESLRSKIDELIKTYDPINRPCFKSQPTGTHQAKGHDLRIPMPGSYITKHYKGRRIEVKVLEKGFEFEGKFYRTLSAIASSITGIHWNGFAFFGIRQNGKR